MNGFAVLDLETTGFSPARGHRIVEIGVVLTDRGGEPDYEWTTLVDPRRDVGPTSIHGVTPAMVANAPVFGDIAGDLELLLEGRILVAHNAKFDLAFLRSEWGRLDRAPMLTPLCTMEMARNRRLPLKLVDCCAHFGLTNPDEHRALGDARVTAALLAQLDPRPEELPEVVRPTSGRPIWSGLHVPRSADGAAGSRRSAPAPSGR